MTDSHNDHRLAVRDARIELLSVELLDGERSLVAEVVDLAGKLKIGLGWHYLLDLAWLYRQLGPVNGVTVLDAGAGVGVFQWLLAERGAHVLSVDRMIRHGLGRQYKRRYRIAGLEPRSPVLRLDGSVVRPDTWPRVVRQLPSLLRMVAQDATAHCARKAPGTVTLINTDLTEMSAIRDGTVDAVVSVSALEHNDLSEIPAIWGELKRVLKPGGCFLATMAASRDCDWFHQPSKGWVLSAATLQAIFDMHDAEIIGFHQYDAILENITACDELREGLAEFYSLSGENGMPWGIWKPRYVPVGIALKTPS